MRRAFKLWSHWIYLLVFDNTLTPVNFSNPMKSVWDKEGNSRMDKNVFLQRLNASFHHVAVALCLMPSTGMCNVKHFEVPFGWYRNHFTSLKLSAEWAHVVVCSLMWAFSVRSLHQTTRSQQRPHRQRKPDHMQIISSMQHGERIHLLGEIPSLTGALLAIKHDKAH